MSLEVVWPLDREDYLFVCDQHPQRYRSTAAWAAQHGEDEADVVPLKPKGFADYRMIAPLVPSLRWVSVRELAADLGCTPTETRLLAHSLLRGARAGRLERQIIPATIQGIQRRLWFYRRAE